MQHAIRKTQYGKEGGFAPIKLLVIVVLGIVIGGGVYWAYKNVGKKEISSTDKGKLTEPVETTSTTKPTIEKTTKTGNFSKKGAAVAQEDGWVLIWDEPGQMAANVKLKFTDQSTCILGGEKKDCGLINLGPESYNRASVEGNRVGDEVTVIKMEELPAYE